ncbi:MAG: PAS domain-containing protein [Solirubrobacterales bacterium]
MAGSQKPLELILARNLLTSVTTPSFLVGRDAQLLFYNEAAGALLGRPFEDLGQMAPEDWTRAFGPFADDGSPIPLEELPLTDALREGRPAHGEFCIRFSDGELHQIAASAMPIVGSGDGASGAMVIFWPVDEEKAREVTTGRHEVVR